jgi:hypothetical protein
MIEPAAGVRDGDVLPVAPQLIASRHHVLAILLATRIRVLRCGDKADGVAVSRCVHLAKRVRAAADANCACRRRPAAACPKPRADPRARAPDAGDFSDRRDAAEQLVVVCDFLDALGTHASAAQHVGEERTDVGETLRTAERDNED